MDQKQQQTRVFKDIALGIFLSMAIVIVAGTIPVLGFFAAMLLPMPTLFYRLKLGRVSGLLVSGITLLLVIFISGGIGVDLLFYGILLVTGLLLGECIERNFTPERTGLVAVLGTAIISGTLFILYFLVTGQKILPAVSGYVAQTITVSLELYREMGMIAENFELIAGARDVLEAMLMRLLPGLILMLLTIVAWTNILFIQKILKTKGLRLKQLEGLNQWRAPELLVWFVIASGIFLFLPLKPLKVVGINFLIIIMPVYFFQGIAIVSFIFEQKKFPTMLRVIIYSIIAIQQIFLLLVAGLGFFDTWINFRKLDIMNAAEQGKPE